MYNYCIYAHLPQRTDARRETVSIIRIYPRTVLFCSAEAPSEDRHDPEPVPDVSNALDRHVQAARHEKIADLFYNPGTCTYARAVPRGGRTRITDRRRRRRRFYSDSVRFRVRVDVSVIRTLMS